MKLPPLNEGRLIKRYKRFLADVEFESGIETPLPQSRGHDRIEGSRIKSLVLSVGQSKTKIEKNSGISGSGWRSCWDPYRPS